MSALTRAQLLALKHQVRDAHAHILDAERAYRAVGDGDGATRAKALSWALAAEVENLDLLLSKTLPIPARVT
jgi:hypothetical protein